MNRFAEGKKKGILRSLSAVVETEITKAYRSPMFWITIIGMIFIPMMFGLMMFIKKYPELAQSSLFLSKAKMIEGDSSWQTYFGLFSQMISGAGMVVFGFAASWIFGREYSDRTIKDLLALPVPRQVMVAGKLIVLSAWSAVLFMIGTITAIILGLLLELSGWSQSYLVRCAGVFSISILLDVGLCMVTAFIACWARGYLAPVGFVFVTMILANFFSMLGYGTVYPWGIPMMYAMKGTEGVAVPFYSIVIVAVTSALGLAVLLLWWRYADQN
ncbi:MAG: ABC transporter permease [Spirochaetes bacterium]|nr:ABC transporter permease [Spirochaetota bacterium]